MTKTMGKIGLRTVAAVLAGRVLPRRLFQRCGPASSRAVALTFDDGPDPDQTPRILDALRDAGVVATFFVVGSKVERHPEVIRRIVEEGHVVGNHSFTHPRPGAIDAAGLVAEAEKTDDVLAAVVGRRASMFRPPYGGLSFKKLLGLWKVGRSLVFWNVDPKDFSCLTVDEVRSNLSRRPLRAGDVILMHDTVPFAAALIPEIAASVRRLGLTFTTPDAWGRHR